MAERLKKSGPGNIVEILRQRAVQIPTNVAYRFLPGKMEEVKELTYGQLDHRARAIGGWLMSTYGKNFPIALLFPPGLEYVEAFYGTMYGGGIAVPLNPPASRNATARLEKVLENANCRVALTTLAQLPRVVRARQQCPELSKIEFIPVETIHDNASSDWRDPCTDPESIVMVQYTSGSTESPKGVRLRDRNLFHNVSLMMQVSGLDQSDVGVSWLPHYHDMGLVAGILMPAFGGFPVVLLSPGGFLSEPIRWLDAISKYRATVSGAPNFGYEECVRRIREEEIDRIDLSSWRVAYCGAEPIRAGTLKSFEAAFARRGFRQKSFFPCYGLAESTLMVTGGPAESLPVVRWLSRIGLQGGYVIDVPAEGPDATSVLASGALIPGNKIIIANSEKVVCESGRVGEIWLAGPSVADGYWNSADATEEVFKGFLAETNDGPFLRTGDLGFVENEMLFVVGRCKDLIIIRGLNHFPQDIELTVERCHLSLVPGCGAAFSIDVEGEEKLVMVHEVDRHLAKTEHQSVFESIVAGISKDHGIQVHVIALIKQSTIAKTTSGKVQRHRIRSEFLSNRLVVVAQWQASPGEGEQSSRVRTTVTVDVPDFNEGEEIERIIASELAHLLRIDINQVDPRRSIYDLGLDSLLAAQLRNRILSKLNVELTQSEIMGAATIRGMMSLLLIKKMGTLDRRAEGQLAQILEQVERLPEDKVAEMLRAVKASDIMGSESAD
jgi:acyl-CoA synthetase (AMP-forming)/AMP-acid ligase II/acyl carrier protein